MSNISAKKLNANFYKKDAKYVAKKLLGKILVRTVADKLLAAKIVETEAYLAHGDESCHASKGLTQRNKTMFFTGGVLYVYLIYGVHYCCNIVTGKEGEGEAVLLRAVEPIENIDEMFVNRFGEKEITDKKLLLLTNGPAKLCDALSITKEDDNTNLLGNNIYILDAPAISEDKIITTTRIGITKSVDLPLRFYIKNNPFVSKK